MKRYKIINTLKAQRDLDSISDYTVINWGVKQHDKYMDGIKKRVLYLQNKPLNFAKKHDEIATGLCSVNYKSHKIFFMVSDDAVRILRVLHNSSDWQTKQF